MGSELDTLYDRSKLKVNDGKSKVVVCKRIKYDIIDYDETYRVRKQCELSYEGQVCVRKDS